MQDIQQDQNFSFFQLKAENAELKSENTLLKFELVELKADNKQLVEQCEYLARLALDLQETVQQLKNEIDRLKGQKSRPKFPPATLGKGDSGKHFGPDLIAYCLDQYHGRCVTRPQLLEQLLGYGVEISSGVVELFTLL